MRVVPFGGKRCALRHAEAVLFVRDDKAQVLECNALGEQRVRADYQADLAGLELFRQLFLFASG